MSEFPSFCPEPAKIFISEQGKYKDCTFYDVVTADIKFGELMLSKNKPAETSLYWRGKLPEKPEKSVADIAKEVYRREMNITDPDGFEVVIDSRQMTKYESGGLASCLAHTEIRSKDDYHEYINASRANQINLLSVNYTVRDIFAKDEMKVIFRNNNQFDNQLNLVRSRWSEGVVGWVMKHHAKQPDLAMKGVKPDAIFNAISQIGTS